METLLLTIADNADYTVTAPANVVIDAVGDIDLDADGNHVNIKNGAGGDTVTLGLADNGTFTIGAPSLLQLM